MLIVSTLVALAAQFPASFAAADEVPWPVHVVDSDRHPGGRSPLLVVGSLFTGGHCYREMDGNRVHATPADEIVMPARCVSNKFSPVMAEYLLGNVRPRPGCDEEETCLFLTSPALENGHEFTVDSVSFDGRAWRVTATYWHDDVKHQWSPGANREGQMVRLGWLPPGDYACKLTLEHRFMKADAPRKGVYELTRVLSGETKFTVGKGDPWRFHPWDQAPSAAVIREEDLTPCKFEAGPPLQPLYYAARREVVDPAMLKSQGAAREAHLKAVESLTTTAPLDWRKYAQKSATLWEAPAGAPADGVLTARIVGGARQVMGRHDWAEVTAVEWFAGENPPKVRIHARVWRRALIDGNPEVRSVPAFAVPLAADGLSEAQRGALKVEAVWSEGRDDPRGAAPEVGR